MTEEPFNFRRILLPAFGPSLLFGIAEGAVIPMVALSARDLGSTVSLAAFIVTLMGIGSLLTNIPASFVTAKYGEWWAIVGAGVWGALAMLLCMIAVSLWAFAVGIFMLGMSGAVFKLARQSYLTEAVPIRLRARALSTLGGVMRIGVFVGPFIGAALIIPLGLGGSYLIGMVALLGAGALALSIPVEPAAKAPRHATPPGPTLRSVASTHSKVFLTVGTAVLLIGSVRAARQVVIPLWAEALGLDAATASLIYGLSGAIDMAVFYPAGKAMDIKGRRWVAVPSMLLVGISLALTPLTGGAGSLILVSLLMGFGNGIGSGLVMTLGADFAPSPGRPPFLGIWRFISDTGTSTGPAILAGTTALASLPIGIWATAFVGLLAAGLLWRWLPPNKHHPSGP